MLGIVSQPNPLFLSQGKDTALVSYFPTGFRIPDPEKKLHRSLKIKKKISI
jgi:hypothetical protein